MDEVIEWRRHLHRHPEVSFEEHETSAWIAQRLEAFGLSVERPTETSVLARLGSGSPVVALRADIDRDAIVLFEAADLRRVRA